MLVKMFLVAITVVLVYHFGKQIVAFVTQVAMTVLFVLLTLGLLLWSAVCAIGRAIAWPFRMLAVLSKAAEPAEPTAEPAKPAAEPAKPAAEPAEPTAEPAKPAAEPADPTAKEILEEPVTALQRALEKARNSSKRVRKG